MFAQQEIDKISKVFEYIKKKKYWIVFPFFIVFMLYFSRHSLYNQRIPEKRLKELQKQRERYRQQIIKNTVILNKLRTDPSNLEHFAREKYLMKKKNEDVFVIIHDSI